MLRVEENKIIQADKIKDVLITRTAIKPLQSERTVEAIISFQFENAKEATRKHMTVEISGFGVFFVSKAKVKKRIKKYQRAIDYVKENPTDINKDKLEKFEEIVRYLKTKLEEGEDNEN